MEQHLGHLKNVGFSAEHGGFFREIGSREWTNFTKSLDMSWMSEVEDIYSGIIRRYGFLSFSFFFFMLIDSFLFI